MTGLPVFDPAAGVLRVEREDFLVLAAIAREPEAEVGPLLAERVDALTAAGAIVDGRVHPALEGAFAAVNAPVCRLSVEWAGARGDGWVRDGAAVLLVESGGDPAGELVVVHPTYLPVTIAQLTGFPSDRGTWRVAVRWQANAGAEGGRDLDVLNASGYRLIRSGPGTAWEPGTPTTIWRRLSGLLPRAGELAHAAGPAERKGATSEV